MGLYIPIQAYFWDIIMAIFQTKLDIHAIFGYFIW